MHFVKVTVLRDETASILVHVAAWEVPILEAKHGEERVSVGETTEFPAREWPTDARSEKQRLDKLYGVTSAADGAPTFCERVYGGGSVGVRNLERAMTEAREAHSKKATPAKRGRGRPPAAPDLIGGAAAG